MENDQWREVISRINRDISGIIKAQRTLEEIEKELSDRKAKPLEEDFVLEDALGQHPGEPREFNIEGVRISVRLLHRRGQKQKDIKGADLLYEIAGRKFILLQYKIPVNASVQRDKDQLDTLVKACPNECPPYDLSYFPTCASWFTIKTTNESLYLPACRVASIFGDATSRKMDRFSEGVSAETFQQLFARCWIGARIAQTELVNLTWDLMEQDDVLITVIQRGSFGRM